MKNYTEFLNERKQDKLTSADQTELEDFLGYVHSNMDNEPSLLRAAYARIQGVLNQIRKGNCPKDKLSYFFHIIFMFIEGHRPMPELKKWAEELLTIDTSSYDTLIRIIDEYNQLAHKVKGKNDKIFNIKSWAFEQESMEPVMESKGDDVDKLYHSSLKDDYWEKISDLYPNYNDTDSDDYPSAVKYIYGEMKKKYTGENWVEIEKEMKNKILDGIS